MFFGLNKYWRKKFGAKNVLSPKILFWHVVKIVHQINLDLPPNQRWSELGKLYSAQLKHTLATIIGLINKINDKIVPYIEEVNILSKYV